MHLKFKFLLPLFATVVVFGSLGAVLIRGQLDDFQTQVLQSIAESKSREVSTAVATLAAQGLEKAALFSRRLDVIQTYALALQGDISREDDPMAQKAREQLRQLLKDDLSGYKALSGKAMQLHFHLANGRSLVRMWRDKQTKRDGQWVDISDDLSGFRKTVLQVNRDGKPLQGVEVGSGGFAIRGIAPVLDGAGKQLGSVETLESFEAVIAGSVSGKDQHMVVYMNADFLPVATELQNPQKNPVLDKRFVLVTPTEEGSVEQLVSATFLTRAQAGPVYERHGQTALAAFPLKDYAGTQAGILVYSFDASSWNAATATVGWYILGLMGLVLLASSLVTTVMLVRLVTRPIAEIVRRIEDITEDRADLSSKLDIATRDEIGELCSWFNQLMAKLRTTLSDVAVYKNIVNSISDPIFAVDDEYRILVANTAMLHLADCDSAAIHARTCRSILNTSVCGTTSCPIHQVMQTQAAYTSGIIEINVDGKSRHVQPFGDVLYDAENKPMGYFEIAREVSMLVEREQHLHEAMTRMETVTTTIHDVVHALTDASRSISAQVEATRKGTGEQSLRIAEISTAMEQMNSAILDVAKSATEAATGADASFEQAREGAAVVEEVVRTVQAVHDRTDELGRSMGALGEQAEAIGRIMNVISDIADQTNLLALNAAIEAARAGDAGRGFAVVADEVRKLAEKTMHATKEVGQAISGIQSRTRDNIAGMHQAAEVVLGASQQARRAGEALVHIVPLVQKTSSRITAIATASEEQSSSATEMTHALASITSFASATASGMEQAAGAVEELARLAEQLQDLAEARR